VNARAVAAWSASGLLVVVLTNNPAYRGLVLLAALNFVVAHRRPATRLRPLLMLLAVATLISIVVSLMLSHTGAHVLLVLPQAIPVFGGPLTIESAIYGAGAGLGIAAGAMVVAPLSLVVESYQLVDALPAPLHRAGTTLAASLNLIPGIARSAAEIRDAQRMRRLRCGQDAFGSGELDAGRSSLRLDNDPNPLERLARTRVGDAAVDRALATHRGRLR